GRAVDPHRDGRGVRGGAGGAPGGGAEGERGTGNGEREEHGVTLTRGRWGGPVPSPLSPLPSPLYCSPLPVVSAACARRTARPRSRERRLIRLSHAADCWVP